MSETHIAVGQMTSGIDPEANLAEIRRFAQEARSGGASMLFLPEMSVLLDRDRERSQQWITAEADSPWPLWLGNCARDHQLWIHIGSAPFVDASGTRRVNRSLVLTPGGEIAARYDKIHMFDVDLPGGESWRESALYEGGDQVELVDTPAGRLGLTICFDLRFPELYGTLVDAGATVIAIPAAFTAPTGAAHWHVLLRARAIETGCYVIAAAQSGLHADGRRTFGHSLIIDPWGRILAEAETEGPQLLFATLDGDDIVQARQAIPLATSRAARHLSLPRLVNKPAWGHC